MVWIGVDVSKGFIDVLSVTPSGEEGRRYRFDDTGDGHQAWWQYLSDCHARFGSVRVGLESTGGLERNWMRSFAGWRRRVDSSTAVCSLVDPRAVHRLAGSLPDRCKTDPSSARAIAEYLRMMDAQLSHTALPQPERAFFRSIMALQGMASKLVNQIKSLLPETHPCLVASTHASGIPGWVQAVLKRYPTTSQLARARLQTLARIPYVTLWRAEDLLAQARATPASLDGEMAASHMRGLIHAYEQQQALVEGQWRMLKTRCCGQADYRRLLTIPGLGEKTAMAWIAELPPVACFRTANALVGYIGLDPVFDQSGDGVVQKGISHRGSPELRQLLYMAARSGISCNPALRRFYQRLRGAGKKHDQALVACMAKLVRIAYACLVTGKDFDPKRSLQDGKRTAGEDKRVASEPLGRSHAITSGQEAASPVSPRERRRRAETKRQQESQRGQSLKRAGSPAAAKGEVSGATGNRKQKNPLKCTG